MNNIKKDIVLRPKWLLLCNIIIGLACLLFVYAIVKNQWAINRWISFIIYLLTLIIIGITSLCFLNKRIILSNKSINIKNWFGYVSNYTYNEITEAVVKNKVDEKVMLFAGEKKIITLSHNYTNYSNAIFHLREENINFSGDEIYIGIIEVPVALDEYYDYCNNIAQKIECQLQNYRSELNSLELEISCGFLKTNNSNSYSADFIICILKDGNYTTLNSIFDKGKLCFMPVLILLDNIEKAGLDTKYLVCNANYMESVTGKMFKEFLNSIYKYGVQPINKPVDFTLQKRL